MNANQTVLNDYVNKHPFAVAQALELLPDSEVADFFQSQSIERSTKLFSLMNPKKVAAFFVLLPPQVTRELIEKADVSLVASLLRNINLPARNNLLASTSAGRLSDIKQRISFLPNTVAAIMEMAEIVNDDLTIENAIRLVSRNSAKEQFYLYVIDLDGTFKGVVRLKDLFLAENADTLGDLMITAIPGFLTDIPVESILKHPAWLDYQEVPVLDAAGKLLGKLPHKSTLKFSVTPSKTLNNEISETGNALGELYRIGINGLLQGGGK